MDSKAAETSAESETLARRLVFILAIPAMVYVDWNMGFTLLNSYSAGAYLIFMAVPVLMAIRYKSHSIGLISRSSVPVGVVVASLNTIHLMGNMGDLESSMFASRLVFAPLALGVLVSYLLPLVDTADSKLVLVLARKEQLITVALTLVALYAVWVFLFQEQGGFSALIDTKTVVISAVVTAICMVYPGNENLSKPEKAARSGLFICVMAAVLGVAFYSFGAAMGPRFMGPAAAVGVLTILYGSFLVYVATVLGGQNSMDAKEARYFDWHLIESWVFLALMLLAPLTVFESIV
jgi:hypothetical protein